MSCKIIAFSGIDGSGKSTQIENLRNHYGIKNTVTYHLRIGYTPLFCFFKRLLLTKQPPLGASSRPKKAFGIRAKGEVWLILALLDYAIFIIFYLRYIKFFKRVVILDRYLFDSLYDFNQFTKNKIYLKLMRWINLIATPVDHGFLLLITPEESLRRSILKNDPYSETFEELEKKYAYYHARVEGNFVFVEAKYEANQVFDDILREIESGKTPPSRGL